MCSSYPSACPVYCFNFGPLPRFAALPVCLLSLPPVCAGTDCSSWVCRRTQCVRDGRGPLGRQTTLGHAVLHRSRQVKRPIKVPDAFWKLTFSPWPRCIAGQSPMACQRALPWGRQNGVDVCLVGRLDWGGGGKWVRQRNKFSLFLFLSLLSPLFSLSLSLSLSSLSISPSPSRPPPVSLVHKVSDTGPREQGGGYFLYEETREATPCNPSDPLCLENWRNPREENRSQALLKNTVTTKFPHLAMIYVCCTCAPLFVFPFHWSKKNSQRPKTHRRCAWVERGRSLSAWRYLLM